MSTSPTAESSRRRAGSPSKPGVVNPSASAATFSPRRPNVQRSAGGEVHVSLSAGSRLATSLALAAQDILLTAAATSPPGTAKSSGHSRAGISGSGAESGNPHVRAIQSRVAELVRRYDESMDSGRGDEDDDEENSRLDIPTRWRVGDLLLATHSSLAKTSTRTERIMMAEFTDDPDVSTAIGEGEQNFSVVLEQAAQTTEQMKAVLTKTLNVVKQMQLSDEMEEANASKDAAGAPQKLRELKSTVEALHKEKSMVLAQLHEHVKSHKEMMAMMEDQSQELRKAQIAIDCKQDELKAARDDFAFRLNDLQKMNETSQQTVGMWRDKFQATLKTLGEAEQKVAELEQRVHAETEEVMKHDFILRAKNSELEKLKERLKESESARFRAETAQREAVAAAADSAAEAAAAHKKAEAASKAKALSGDAQSKQAAKDRQDLVAKIRQQEATIHDLQQRLADLTDSRSKFEDDNHELARIVRELQAKAQQVVKVQVPAPTPAAAPNPPARVPSARRTSLTLSLRTASKLKKRRASTANDNRKPTPSPARDDLSTGSDEGNGDSDVEAEQDERELNDTVQQVVTSVFTTRVSSMEDQSDEAIDTTIAQFESDPTNNPLCSDASTTQRIPDTKIFDQRPSSYSISAASGNNTASSNSDDSISELGLLQLAHNEQIERLKKQYVAGLLEYKKLIIEQYERRQSEIQQHHRIEVENLILAVQHKFKRELERRGERVLQAKESLKLLYRAMQSNDLSSGTGSDPQRGRGGLSSFMEEGETDEGESNDGGDDHIDEPVPLKSILRAAVFAMSSSKNRNDQASVEIKRLYEDMQTKKASPHKPAAKVVVKSEMERVPDVVVSVPETKTDTDWASFLKNMRANREATTQIGTTTRGAVGSIVHVACQVDERDFVIFDLKGLRGSHIAPENVDDYVLPSLALLTRSNGDSNTTPRRAQIHGNAGSLDGVLYLNEGALLSDDVVGELRAVLPFLPPGSYFLSAALRHQLLLAMLRFYAELGKRTTGKAHQMSTPSPPQPFQQREETIEIVMGSPRDTPFLRRKAIEAVERRQRLSNGGLAMVQTTSIVPRSTGFMSASMATSTLSHVRHSQFPSL